MRFAASQPKGYGCWNAIPTMRQMADHRVCTDNLCTPKHIFLATDTGHYEERNVFGTPTGKVTHAAEGQSLPAAPRGFTWRLVRPEEC
jgi:hypothetical protein